MNEPSIWIELDGPERAYQPGERLSGQYRIEGMTQDEIAAIEVSILWYTVGKGDEDMAVHQFWRLSTDEGNWIDPTRPARFETVLPASPLSYDGAILAITWCVRVRVFPRRGKEMVGQRDFVLGAVRPGRAVEP